MPSAATTSSSGRMRLTSSGSRRSRRASRASTSRRRARRKSFSTSARGKPVSARIAVSAAPRGQALGQRWPARAARYRADAARPHCAPRCGRAARPARCPRRWDLTCGRARAPARPGAHGHAAAPRAASAATRLRYAAEPAVRQVGAIADAERRGMSQQYVNTAAVAQPAPPRRGAQGPGSPGLLPVGVLVGAAAVAQAPAEPGHPQPGHVDHPAVGVDGAGRPRRPGGQPGPHRQPSPGRAVTRQVGVMVPRHEHQRHVERVHQVAEVVKRQVTAGQDQLAVATEPGRPAAADRERRRRPARGPPPGRAARRSSRSGIQRTAVSRTSRPRARSAASAR